MTRWLIAVAWLGMLLAGCRESRIERKPLVASAARSPQSQASHSMPEPTPQGMTPADEPPADRLSADRLSAGKASPEKARPESAPGRLRQRPTAPQAAERPAAEVKEGEIAIDQIRFSAPNTWIQKPPRSAILLAEFSLPRAEGDPADGRLTVTRAGGSINDNVERWRKQFGPKPEKESQEKIEVGGIPITLVDFWGMYLDQRGPFAPAVESPGYRMLGAIADVEGQLYFVKAYGPAKTMAAHAGEFRAFVDSMTIAGER